MKSIKYIFLLIMLSILGLRLVDISALPNGYSWDEMDNAYQAYSLINTGRDMFGNPMPVFLHSLADYKSSLYIYLTTPWVKLWGPTVSASRTTAAISGIIGVLAMVTLIGRKWGLGWGYVGGMVMAATPWWWHYSRVSSESTIMMAMFLIALACLPKKLLLSAAMFGLAIWSYSTAKFFIPAFILSLLVVYRKQIKTQSLIVPALVLSLISFPPIFLSLFGKGGTRFHEIAIFTDPTTAAEVNYSLEQGQISSGVNRKVGLNPRLIDRLAHNKFQLWSSRFIDNYLTFFSPQFLFLRGDPNLHHNPGKDTIGQLLLSDVVLLALGVYLLRRYPILIAWLLIAPIPAALTRDGAGHATRGFFLLPPLVILITAGWRRLCRYRWTIIPMSLVTCYFFFAFGYYYFSYYRWESIQPFQWGFEKLAQIALENTNKFDQIIIDTGETSALMAYLVTNRYDPASLQNLHPWPQAEVAGGITANKFDNIYILPPGRRNWSNLSKLLPTSTLLIYFSQEGTSISYPNGLGGFIIKEH